MNIKVDVESPKTHLEYYEQHKISPVSYNLKDLGAHFERRQSLYTMLGVPPVAFRSSSILEVAAGTGHNSLYLAKQLPKELVLLEPNSTGVTFIHDAYASFSTPHTKPKIVTSKLEDFFPSQKFEIVLCENWLGCSKHEISLLEKLGSFVDKDGILILTTVSPIGFVPNLLRRFISVYLCPLHETFERKTEILVDAFGSHLDTLVNMTRNKKDWVQDNMLNPAYFDLCLTVPKVIEELGDKFRVTGSSPSFNEDWRWFKNLSGSECKWNEHFLFAYWKKAHNFLDYRSNPSILQKEQNQKLEACALELLYAIKKHELAYFKADNLSVFSKEVLSLLQKFRSLVPQELEGSKIALDDAYQVITKVLNGEKKLFASNFDSLFSRETTYLALTRLN